MEKCYKCKGEGKLYPVYHDGEPIKCWVCEDKKIVDKLAKKYTFDEVWEAKDFKVKD